MSAAGQRWPRCLICGETRNHRHACNDNWHRRGQEDIMQRAMQIAHERHGSPVIETLPNGVEVVPCFDVTTSDLKQARKEVMGR